MNRSRAKGHDCCFRIYGLRSTILPLSFAHSQIKYRNQIRERPSLDDIDAAVEKPSVSPNEKGRPRDVHWKDDIGLGEGRVHHLVLQDECGVNRDTCYMALHRKPALARIFMTTTGRDHEETNTTVEYFTHKFISDAKWSKFPACNVAKSLPFMNLLTRMQIT